MAYQPYPEYRDSGVEWLGDIPEGWEAKRIKYASSFNDDLLPENTDLEKEIIYVDISSVASLKGIINREAMLFQDAPSRARRIVKSGDIIVSTVRTYLRAISPIRDNDNGLIVSTGFAVVRPNDGLLSTFAFYALRAPYFVEEIVGRSVGVSYPAVNASDIQDIRIAIPPLTEQTAIAAFLDRETARIDQLIEKKRRLIELLEEKRTALISHAVTKGLDPDASMKDSGVEWLGDIPEGWEVYRVKNISRINYGDSLSVDNRKYGEVKVYGSNGPVGVHNEANTKSPVIIIGRKGSYGKIVYSYNPCFTIDTTFYIDASITSSNLRWLFYSLSILNLDEFSEDSAVPGLSREYVYNCHLSYPPLSEQTAIAAFLDRETARINQLIDKVREGINKLTEYRTALISAAVTGKIDVRE